MSTSPTLAIGLCALILFGGCEAFLKAAMGLRIGYSPTEKGYGKPYQYGGLYGKDPALKGQFLTGVQQPSKPKEQSPPGSPEGTKLLRHLKILGVNLYLGAPQGPHQQQHQQQQGPPPGYHATNHPPQQLQQHQNGPPIFQQPQQQHGPLLYPGPVPSHEQNGHYNEFRAIDAENGLGYGNSPSHSHLVGQSVSPPNNFHSNPQYPSYHSNEVIPSAQPPPPHPPRPSGSPLMSTLMRGLQWTTSHSPRIFRIPLLLSYNRPQQQQQPPPPTVQTPQAQSLQRTYSTLFNTNPNQQLQAGSNYPQFNPIQQGYLFSQYPYAPQQMNHAPSSYFPDQGQSSTHQQQHEHSNGGYQEYRPQYNEQQEYQGVPQYNSPQSMGIPDDFRPHDQGFSYSHSESSPAVSMGTTTYDDPPVEMGGGGYNEQPHPQQSSPDREAERRGSVLTPNPVPANGMNLFTAQSSKKETLRPRHHRGHLENSLRRWNPILDKYRKNRDDMVTQASTLISSAEDKEKEIKRKRVMRIRSTTTKTTTTPTTTISTSSYKE